MPFSVRPATLADAPTIAEFNRRLAIETEGKTLNAQTLGAGVAAILADRNKGRYFVTHRDGEGLVDGHVRGGLRAPRIGRQNPIDFHALERGIGPEAAGGLDHIGQRLARLRLINRRPEHGTGHAHARLVHRDKNHVAGLEPDALGRHVELKLVTKGTRHKAPRSTRSRKGPAGLGESSAGSPSPHIV